MSRAKWRDVVRFYRGFLSDRPIIDDPSFSSARLDQVSSVDYATSGSSNVLFIGQSLGVPFKGLTSVAGKGATVNSQVSNGIGSLGRRGADGSGSVFSYIGRSIWFIGGGELMFNGTTLTSSPTASTTLRYRLYETAAYNGTTYTAGIASPAAPTIAAGAVGTKLSGTYSVRLTAIKSSTGAESNASVMSATVSLSNQKMRITFPAAMGNGHDLWGVYVTAANTGSRGPHLSLPPSLTGESPVGFVKETTVVASALGGAGLRNLDFEWADGDLVGGNLAPITNGVPPVGTHAFTLEGCMAVVGCYAGVDAVSTTNPGNMIAVSRAGFPEAFPADINHLLALPEPPTLVLPRAAGGYVYVAGKNSLSVVRYTGSSSLAPLSLSVLWPDVGFANPSNACLADGILYGYSAVKGVVRIDSDGNPDYTFGTSVLSQFAGINAADVSVGYDVGSNMVVYGFTSGGVSRLMCYNKAYNVWSTPIKFEDLVSTVSGTVKGMYTNAGVLYIVIDTGSTDYAIYQFNVGSGSTWKLKSPWRDGGAPEKNKTIHSLNTSTGNNSVNPTTLKVYTNLSSTASFTKSLVTLGVPEHLRVQRVNLRNTKTYSVELSGTDDDSLGLEATLEGIISEIDS